MHGPEWETVFVGVGSNMGDRQAAVDQAARCLELHTRIDLVQRSVTVDSAPWGELNQPRFLNAVFQIQTSLSPLALLDALKKIETAMGRTPKKRWGPRIIDLDILLFGQQVIYSHCLTIPHVHLMDRWFALIPLVSLNADLIHPVTGQRLSDVARTLATT